MGNSFAALLLLSAASLPREGFSETKCSEDQDGALILNNGLVLSPGNWDDAVIWSTPYLSLDAGSEMRYEEGSVGFAIGSDLYKKGGGNDVIIGSNGGKYQCKLKYGLELFGETEGFTQKDFFHADPFDGGATKAFKDKESANVVCRIDAGFAVRDNVIIPPSPFRDALPPSQELRRKFPPVQTSPPPTNIVASVFPSSTPTENMPKCFHLYYDKTAKKYVCKETDGNAGLHFEFSGKTGFFPYVELTCPAHDPK